jgi:hypothetical protein
MKFFKYISYIVSLLVIVSVGIVIDNGRAIAANYPQIISVTPGNQEDGISTATTIQIVFDKSMSTEIDFELYDFYGNEVDGIMTWSNTAGNPTISNCGGLVYGMLLKHIVWAEDVRTANSHSRPLLLRAILRRQR